MNFHIEYELTFNSTNIWRGTIHFPKEKGSLADLTSDYINNNIY
jgi:hypothetical protein